MKFKCWIKAALVACAFVTGVGAVEAQDKVIPATNKTQDVRVSRSDKEAYKAITDAENKGVSFGLVARRPISGSKMRYFVRSYKSEQGGAYVIGDYQIDQARTAKPSAIAAAAWKATQATIKSRRLTPLFVGNASGDRVVTVPPGDPLYRTMKYGAGFGVPILQEGSGVVLLFVS